MSSFSPSSSDYSTDIVLSTSSLGHVTSSSGISSSRYDPDNPPPAAPPLPPRKSPRHSHSHKNKRSSPQRQRRSSPQKRPTTIITQRPSGRSLNKIRPSSPSRTSSSSSSPPPSPPQYQHHHHSERAGDYRAFNNDLRDHMYHERRGGLFDIDDDPIQASRTNDNYCPSSNSGRRYSHNNNHYYSNSNVRRSPFNPTIDNPNRNGEQLLFSDEGSPKRKSLLQKEDEEEVYIVKQRYGYCSVFFSVIQSLILALMMWQCGIAPLQINPMFGPYPDALSEWGGKNSINILDDDELWRLVTPILLHAGVIHLLCNIAVQMELGIFFEREWGSMTWIVIYLSSAVGASMLSVIFMPNAVSVGSSGAVMGLFGGKLAEVVCRACESTDTQQQRIGHQVRKEQCAGVMCSVIVVMAFSFIPYVDWSAHLGGLIIGLFVGLFLFSIQIQNLCLKLFWFLFGLGSTIACFVCAYLYMYSGAVEVEEDLRDVCGYYQQFFDNYECNCMREEMMANFNNNNHNYGGNGNSGSDSNDRWM